MVDSELEAGWATVRLSTADAEPVEAPVRVVNSDVRFGILSDIDDTVMVAAAAARGVEHIRAGRARACGRVRVGATFQSDQRRDGTAGSR